MKMKDASAPQSNEAVEPQTPTARDGQRALIEHLAQAVIGSPQSPRRTASDTTRGTAVPLLYTELYNENGFGPEMTPVQMTPKSDVHVNGSPYKNRATSSSDLEPLQEINSSLSLSSLSSNHELLDAVEVPLKSSKAVISRKERNHMQLPSPVNMATPNVGNLNGSGNVGNHNGHPDVAGKATKTRNEPFDPQRTYPSDACIFVANLLEGAPDEKLAEALTVVFGQYGTVFIKIKRKSTNMPYAFVQYTNSSDARAAMQGARGARVLDRVCRMEPANSKRFWIVRRADGKPSSVAEIRQALAGQGASSIQEAQDTVLEALGIDHGIRVEFPQWDQSRDLRRTISSRFIAEPLDEFALTRRQQHTTAAQGHMGRKTNGDDSQTNGTKLGADGKVSPEASSRWSFMERYDRDRRSVFCGNLPSNTTETELREVFGRAGGQVKSVEIIPCPHSAYAFIEFSRADICEAAIELLNGGDLRGMGMKVERKRARVPGPAPSPTYQQRFASLPHRAGGLASQREPQNFTPVPSPRQGQNGAGVTTGFQPIHHGSGQPTPNGTIIGSPTPPAEATAQDQSDSALAQRRAQYINYLRCLLNAQQHAQAMHAAQSAHTGQPANGQYNHDSARGFQDTTAQTGSQSPEHLALTAENGTGLGGGLPSGGPGMFNPLTVPYPLPSPDGGVFPNGVPFMGMPYGLPLSPTYPITPGHLLGVGNPVASGLPGTGSPVNGVDNPFGAGQNIGPRMAAGQLFNVSNALSSSPGLPATSAMNSGDHHPLGHASVTAPAPTNGVTSYAFAQGAHLGQNGIQHRVNTPRVAGQGLNGGPVHGSH